MRRSRQVIAPLVIALVAGSAIAPARAQLPESALPNPRLTAVFPPGGKLGSVVEVSFAGTDVEEPQALLLSNPALKAEPIVPPTPPADP